MSLLDYQIKHVERLMNALETHNASIDSSDTGTGKTFCACACAQKLKLRPIIVCPKSVISNWAKVATLFDLKPYGISNYESMKGCNWYVDGKKEKCPYLERSSTCEYSWNLPEDTLLIFDEVHRCKNKKTFNAKLLTAVVESNPQPKTLMLSATIADMPKFFGVFALVLKMVDTINLFPIYLRRLQTFAPDQPIMYLLHKLIFGRKQYGSRLKIADLGDKFPKNMIIADSYSMGRDVEMEIQRRYEFIHQVMQEAKTKREAATIKLVELLRARQQVEALKLPTMMEMITDHLESNMSVVVFVNFNDSLNLLADHFKCKCLIHGDQSKDERDKSIDDFQSNKQRLIICNIRSGGVGISLHDIHGGHPRVALISPSWSAQDLVQALGRIHRAGSKTPALQKLVYCANTVEEQICATIQKKINNYAQINNGQMKSTVTVSEEKVDS